MLIVAGYVYVDPAVLARFISDLQVLALTARQRAGNIRYDVAVENPQKGRLLVSEYWTDQLALTAHLDANDTVAFIRRWRGRMQSNIRKFDASNERKLMDD